jgi:hypothetical protein
MISIDVLLRDETKVSATKSDLTAATSIGAEIKRSFRTVGNAQR